MFVGRSRQVYQKIFFTVPYKRKFGGRIDFFKRGSRKEGKGPDQIVNILDGIKKTTTASVYSVF